MLILKVDGQFTDAGLATLERDPLLAGDAGGVRFLFDAAFPFSYAGGAPANDALIRDVAEVGDGSFVKVAGQTIGFNGNGFDFSTMTENAGSSENLVIAPAAVWDGIEAAQDFLWCTYLRLPSNADWNPETTILPFFASSTGSGNGYVTVPDPLTVAFSATSKQFSFRRQTAIGTQETETITPAAGHYGAVCQVAFWRKAGSVYARLKGAAGTLTTAGRDGTANNTADISACRPRWGSVYPFTAYNLAGHRTGRNYRVYRGFIENLATSGRDPATVLDADYSRVAARGVFS